MTTPAGEPVAAAVIVEPAPAKVNLYLHVVGRRADGYHLLDSLVVFADDGDAVRFCSTCAFGAVCQEYGVDKVALNELHCLVEHVGPFRQGEHLFRTNDPFGAIYAVRARYILRALCNLQKANIRVVFQGLKFFKTFSDRVIRDIIQIFKCVFQTGRSLMRY